MENLCNVIYSWYRAADNSSYHRDKPPTNRLRLVSDILPPATLSVTLSQHPLENPWVFPYSKPQMT